MPDGRAGRAVIAVGILANACGFATTPRLEDASAPRDTYESAVEDEPECDRPIELVRGAPTVARPHREIAHLSATCYPGSPGLCERRLKIRACELKADAVILSDPEPSPVPPGASRETRISMSGRAIRWK